MTTSREIRYAWRGSLAMVVLAAAACTFTVWVLMGSAPLALRAAAVGALWYLFARLISAMVRDGRTAECLARERERLTGS